MFSNGTKQKTTSPEQLTIIDAGTQIEGHLQVRQMVRVYGQLDGRLDADAQAVIAEGGYVDGDISAQTVIVAGTIVGTVRAERVVLRASARLEGKIHTDTLTTEDGAIFTGQCIMDEAAAEVHAAEPSAETGRDATDEASSAEASDTQSSEEPSAADAQTAEKTPSPEKMMAEKSEPDLESNGTARSTPPQTDQVVEARPIQNAD